MTDHTIEADLKETDVAHAKPRQFAQPRRLPTLAREFYPATAGN